MLLLGLDDFIEEQIGEVEMDREGDSEEDTISRIYPNSSDEHSEDDEPSVTTLQPLDMAFLVFQLSQTIVNVTKSFACTQLLDFPYFSTF